MKFIEFLSKNWSQIAVLIGSVGYLLKVILDFNIRKREIKFEYIYKEKASAFQDFLICHQEFKNTLIKQTFQYKYDTIPFSEFETTMNELKNELNNKLNILYMYCTSNEKEDLYEILNQCTFILYEIKKSTTSDVEKILRENDQKSKVIVDRFIKSFHI